jgi:hypothetical protein
MNNEFVQYLNKLHNLNAQNPNAYGEKNIADPFYAKVMVRVGLCDFICNQFANEEPHSIILTGHAGDGKTSIMYQVLDDLDMDFGSSESVFDVMLHGGNQCRCIKDFSEVPDENKTSVLREALEMPDKGNYTFMVANTGPLINTFGNLFPNPSNSEMAKIQLIDAMDNNTGKVIEILGYKVCVINVASIDNTYFASEFLSKIVDEELWDSCKQCEKSEYCHIYRNRNLIVENCKHVYEFITMHYIWLSEHGKRLTIRSMTEQLAYMLTGGIECADVIQQNDYKYLFSNLFFGYIGTVRKDISLKIVAVNEAYMCGYDRKRLRSDEALLENDYENIFGEDVSKILHDAEKNDSFLPGWREFLRRTYIFLNIVTDQNVIEYDDEDIFSKQFSRFCNLRDGKATPSRIDANLVCDALSMIYIGTTNNDQQIPITLSRESGITQNVQLITGLIPSRKVKVIAEETKDSLFNGKRKRYALKIEIENKKLDTEITLPLFDFFEELRNGVVSTNVDPQLSHGIESLKAEISDKLNDDNDESFEMIVLKNNCNTPISLEITETKSIREM